MRKYLRHPLDIPLQYELSDHSVESLDIIKDISICGLCFRTTRCVAKGEVLSIKIPMIDQDFEIKARVIWCSDKGNYVDIGVEFLDPKDSNRVRMIEQVCHIKQFQKELSKKKGRKVSNQEAAQAWIKKYAANFPK